LEIFFRQPEGGIFEHGFEGMDQGVIDLPNGDDVVRISQVAGKLFRIAYRMGGGKGGWQEDRPDILFSQGFAGKRQRNGAVDTAAASDDRLLKPIFEK